MSVSSVDDMIVRDEGTEFAAYPDPLSGGDPWTIGNGHTGPEVVEGLVWGQEQIDAAREADIAKATDECRGAFVWFAGLNGPRRAVLTCMAFQLGLHGLKGFVHMLAFVALGDWARASEDMMQSLWARQTPARAQRMADQMRIGDWV